MKLTLKNEKENPYLKRKEYTIKVDHTGEATPSKAALQKITAKELDTELTKTDIVNIFSKFGSNISDALVYIWEEKEVEDLSKKREEGKDEGKEEPGKGEKKEKGEEKKGTKKEGGSKKQEEKGKGKEEKSGKTEKNKKGEKESEKEEGKTKENESEEEGEEEEEESKEEGKKKEEKKPEKRGAKPIEGKEESEKKKSEKKKKKSGTKKEGKKPKSKSKHNNVQIWKKYEVKNGKVERKSEFCHRCGEGTFIAEYKNRKYCGKCGWGQIKGTGSEG